MPYPVTQRLWLTTDGRRLVRDGDREAHSLYAVPGNHLSDGQARRFGLDTPVDVAAVQGPAATQHIAGPAATTAIQGPARTKSTKRGERDAS